MDKYNHKEIEEKVKKRWQKLGNEKLYQADEKSKAEKKYILDMFPYPSADGLHTGHVESYTATDIISRYLRMKRYNVLHPQGFDAFGLPAENFAIKAKTHPAITTKRAIANFRKQMEMMGLSYDWSRLVNTSNQDYYKWTQWFFLLLYKNGLAYKAKAKVNWCEHCQTVLANEQAEGGICERCQNPVIQKDLEQWFFKITDFLEDYGETSGLLSGLDKIDWPDSTKAAQRNWIGRSEGAQFRMCVIACEAKQSHLDAETREIATSSLDKLGTPRSDKFIEVFTTRLDTVFGMTYAVIASEHPIISDLKLYINNWPEVEKYIDKAKKKSELQRMTEEKEKTGVELKGIKLINPFNNEAIPAFVGDYILAHYGTGAVMAVPGHDKRDYQFAKKHNLPIVEVIKSGDYKSSIEEDAFTDDGVLINSNKYDGLTSEQARKKLTAWLEENKIGIGKINYKIRDWLISRQRYWGAPIPIIYCDKCGEVPVPEKDLPVLLPDDVDFMPTGESPLVRSKKFHNVKCPQCGAKARRESDTMDTFVCSSWYYFRYSDPHNKKEFAAKEQIKKWLPVDLYVGGVEHSVLHLLYSRFFTKVLHKLRYIDFDEPFLKLRHQGIILAEDGRKMSKSFGNVINPDDIVAQYGADALRMFEMFMGPLEDMKQWNMRGIIGIYRFLEKVWRLNSKLNPKHSGQNSKLQLKTQNLERLIHRTIQKVTIDIKNYKFNTAIAQMMITANEMDKGKEVDKDIFIKFTLLLAPFAPYIAEALWMELGDKESIFKQKWPQYDPELARAETIVLVIQVNGKLRDAINVGTDITEDEAKRLALASEKIKKWLEDKEIAKIIFVKGKLVNVVLK